MYNVAASLTNARRVPFWLDTPVTPRPAPALDTDHSTDLLVVGGGFCGLWTALLAKERDPDRTVTLLESGLIGHAASGRNGGFCSASLTHGDANGRRRFPDEFDRLERLGLENLDGIEEAIRKYGISCDFERNGSIAVATEPYQVELMRAYGPGFMDTKTVRKAVDSPTYLAGYRTQSTTAILNPAKLAWGLVTTASGLGVHIHENTHVKSMRKTACGMQVTTGSGHTVTARRVALATNAFPPLLRRLRLHTVPVYDYVLVTQPLSTDQLASIGWAGREGLDDVANQFHYYRLTADNRILWGGYDAIYHYGRRMREEYESRDKTFEKLARHFFDTFPQLRGLEFSHRWAGAIDTCTRFCAFYGSTHKGRVAYAMGFTGLGVGSTRFAGNVMLDLLDGRPTERTQLKMVRRRPLPFPPEPFAFLGIQATRAALAAADRNAGQRNLWLRTLDRLGLGFDS